VHYGPGQRIDAFEPADPSFPRRIRVRHVGQIDAHRTHQVITTPETEFADMFLTEVSRGCFRGCRFCPAGFVYRPARFRTPAALSAPLAEGLRRKGRVGLLGTAVSDHPRLAELCRKTLEAGGGFSIGSLRIDRVTDSWRASGRGRRRDGVAGTRGGFQRLRDVFRKGVTESRSSERERLIGKGIVNLRLYIMVGLPRMRRRMSSRSWSSPAGSAPRREDHEGHPRFAASPCASTFSSPAATPFQWLALALRARAERIQKIMGNSEGALRKRNPRSSKGTTSMPCCRWATARGVSCWRSTKRGNWRQALKQVNVNADFYVYREKDPAEVCPGIHHPRREPGAPPRGTEGDVKATPSP
jgi:hypothetical protein